MSARTTRRLIAVGCAVVGGTLCLTAASRPARHVVVQRYANGQIERETTYRGDQLDGPSRGWYETGEPMFEYAYHRGVAEGTQRQWYRSGQSFTLFHHRAGHEDGQQQMWNADGTIRSNYVIKDRRRYGLIGSMGCTGKGTARPGDMQ